MNHIPLCSHFACNVVHEDIAYDEGVDTHTAKMKLKHIIDEVCGGGLPSEHGHGTEYIARGNEGTLDENGPAQRYESGCGWAVHEVPI